MNDYNFKLHRLKNMHSKYDNMHENIIYINNHVITSICWMLSITNFHSFFTCSTICTTSTFHDECVRPSSLESLLYLRQDHYVTWTANFHPFLQIHGYLSFIEEPPFRDPSHLTLFIEDQAIKTWLLTMAIPSIIELMKTIAI